MVTWVNDAIFCKKKANVCSMMSLVKSLDKWFSYAFASRPIFEIAIKARNCCWWKKKGETSQMVAKPWYGDNLEWDLFDGIK